MSAAELAEWKIIHAHDPIGHVRADMYLAQILSTQIQSKKRIQLKDLIPFRDAWPLTRKQAEAKQSAGLAKLKAQIQAKDRANREANT